MSNESGDKDGQLPKIIDDLLMMRREEAKGVMVMANSDDTMFEDCVRRLREEVARSSCPPLTEDDFGAHIADCIASAHRNSGLPNPEFPNWKLDALLDGIWQLSYEINRLRALKSAEPTPVFEAMNLPQPPFPNAPRPECATISRNWTEDFAHENGNYNCQCVDCDNPFIGHKRRIQCKACAEARKNDGPTPSSVSANAEPLKIDRFDLADQSTVAVSKVDLDALEESRENWMRRASLSSTALLPEDLWADLLPHWGLVLATYKAELKKGRHESYAIREGLIRMADAVREASLSAIAPIYK